MPLSERITEYEKNTIFAFLSENVYTSPGTIILIDDSSKKSLITDIDLRVLYVNENKNKIYFQVEIFEQIETLSCDITGKYYSEERKFKCLDGRNEYFLSEFFNEHPITFKTIDDTVFYGHEVLKGNLELERFDQNRVIPIDWPQLNVDTSIECGKNEETGEISIQDGLKEWLLIEKKLPIYFSIRIRRNCRFYYI